MPEIKQQITTGNIASLLGIIVLIIGVGRIYGVLDTSMSGHAKTIAEHEGRIMRLERDTTDRLARIETILHRIEKGILP